MRFHFTREGEHENEPPQWESFVNPDESLKTLALEVVVNELTRSVILEFPPARFAEPTFYETGKPITIPLLPESLMSSPPV